MKCESAYAAMKHYLEREPSDAAYGMIEIPDDFPRAGIESFLGEEFRLHGYYENGWDGWVHTCCEVEKFGRKADAPTVAAHSSFTHYQWDDVHTNLPDGDEGFTHGKLEVFTVPGIDGTFSRFLGHSHCPNTCEQKDTVDEHMIAREMSPMIFGGGM